MKRTLLPVAALLLALGACGSSSSTSSEKGEPTAAATTSATPSRPTDAKDLADALRAKIPTVTKVTVYTEDNDPNDLLGRPNGYTQAALLTDKRATSCDTADPGIDCGAVIEVWKSPAAAKKRATYIESLLSGGGLGSEYHYLQGNQLLRVSGDIKPSEAKAYEAAWKDLG